MMTWFKSPARGRRLSALHLTLETLEDRRLLAGTVLQTNLVSDLPGVAENLDPNLVNPWGISEAGTSPFWVSDNGSGQSTLYNTTGTPQSLVVKIPSPGDPLGSSGTPTGTVFNTGGGFKVAGFHGSGAFSAPAIFLFATEDGTIVGWNPNVNPVGFDPTKAGTYGTIAVDNSAGPAGAVYKGLAIASTATPIFSSDANTTSVLYAANFRSGKVEVYNTNFQPVNNLPSTAFADPDLPRGYAPFNVQVLRNKVYVTYAKQDATKHDDDAGNGRGFVDVFNLDGTPGLAGGQERLVSRGPLNSPWGLALAPSSFGALTGALLVGNFGDGHIHAYNASTGAPMGQLTDPDGEPVVIPGLWALKVGNGGNGGDTGTVYFTAGLDHENHGLFGSLVGVAPGTEGAAEANTEAQMVQAELDVVSLDATTVINDITQGVPKVTLRQDLQTLKTAVKDLRDAEKQFVRDTHTVYQGSTDQGGATLQSLKALFDQLENLKKGGHGDDDNGDDNDNGHDDDD